MSTSKAKEDIALWMKSQYNYFSQALSGNKSSGATVVSFSRMKPECRTLPASNITKKARIPSDRSHLSILHFKMPPFSPSALIRCLTSVPCPLTAALYFIALSSDWVRRTWPWVWLLRHLCTKVRSCTLILCFAIWRKMWHSFDSWLILNHLLYISVLLFTGLTYSYSSIKFCRDRIEALRMTIRTMILIIRTLMRVLMLVPFRMMVGLNWFNILKLTFEDHHLPFESA